MKVVSVSSIWALVVVCLPAISVAEGGVEAAEAATRALIKSKVGSHYRVVFDSHSEKLLSLSEEVVSGTGHIVDKDNWNFDRSFTYTIKVKYDGSSTRELSVAFSDGEKQTESSGWKKVQIDRQFVQVTRPNWYEKLDTERVVFEGKATSDVTIVVFNKKNDRVANQNVSARGGTFKTLLTLPNGTFRAVVMLNGSQEGTEIRFSVNDNSHDWGLPDSYFKVSEPKKETRLANSRVTFAGNSSERSVRLQVWDSRNDRVVDKDIPVRDRYWNSQVVLKDGSYKFSASSGTGIETRFFTVDTKRVRAVKVQTEKMSQGMVSVRVLQPERDSVVSGPRVTVSGNSPEESVLVEIWSDKNKRLVSRRVPTEKKYFNTSIPLSRGRYRVKVVGAPHSDYEEFWFNVR